MKALIPIPDAPGYYVDLFFRMGEALKQRGVDIIFVATSPYYPKSRKIDLAKVGKVYYLNEYLENTSSIEWSSAETESNSWAFYSTFVRQSYFWGKHKNKFQQYAAVCQFIDTIIDDHKITFIASELISSSFLYIIYNAATKRKIPHFCYSASRIAGYFNIFMDDLVTVPLLNEKGDELDQDLSKPPDYMNNSRFGGVFDKTSSVGGLLKEIVRFIASPNYTSWEIGNSKRYIIKTYGIFFRRWAFDLYLKRFKNIFDKDIPDDPEKIRILCPLHFRPEASTSVQAKFFEDDYEVLKNIAFSLKKNQFLIVKEHKSNVGNNKLSFYKRIKALPNTILLDPYYPLKSNISKFDAAVCLTSTVGYEALEQSVPVFVLGRVFYEDYPGCIKLKSFEDVESSIGMIKKNTPHRREDITELYHRTNFAGSFNYMNPGCLSQDNIERLIRPIISYYEAVGSPGS